MGSVDRTRNVRVKLGRNSIKIFLLRANGGRQLKGCSLGGFRTQAP